MSRSLHASHVHVVWQSNFNHCSNPLDAYTEHTFAVYYCIEHCPGGSQKHLLGVQLQSVAQCWSWRPWSVWLQWVMQTQWDIPLVMSWGHWLMPAATVCCQHLEMSTCNRHITIGKHKMKFIDSMSRSQMLMLTWQFLGAFVCAHANVSCINTHTIYVYQHKVKTTYVKVNYADSCYTHCCKPVIVAFIASSSGWDCPSVYMRSTSDVLPFSRSTGGSLISNRLTYANTGVELNSPSLTWKLMALVIPLKWGAVLMYL